MEQQQPQQQAQKTSRGKFEFLVAVGIVCAVLGVIGAFVVIAGRTATPMNETHVYEPAVYPTAADARAKSLHLAVPQEATNIRYAEWSIWTAHGKYMRFEAPVDVCLRHVGVMVPGGEVTPVPPAELPIKMPRVEPNTVKDVSWFDLPAATDVVTASVGGPAPRVWVDRTRGVFYYHVGK